MPKRKASSNKGAGEPAPGPAAKQACNTPLTATFVPGTTLNTIDQAAPVGTKVVPSFPIVMSNTAARVVAAATISSAPQLNTAQTNTTIVPAVTAAAVTATEPKPVVNADAAPAVAVNANVTPAVVNANVTPAVVNADVTPVVKADGTPVAKVEGTTPVKLSEVTEGKATVKLPDSVFYNPVQEFNRDLTIAVIKEFINEAAEKLGMTVGSAGTKDPAGIRILEALGASGLRSVRFGLELPGVKEIVCNDFDEKAVQYITANAQNNGVSDIVRPNHGDAALVMYQCRRYETKYDVIDLDPYGSPAPFLDGAVQAVKNGGLLCVTATDMAVMSGNCGETAFTKYGSYSVRTKSVHEMALRILLNSIESHATRYSKYIIPVLCVSVDFYIRVFVRVFEGQGQAKLSASKKGLIYQCQGCNSQAVQPLGDSVMKEDGNYKHTASRGPPVDRRCQHCGETHRVAGPVWIDKLHDKEFCQRVYKAVSAEPARYHTNRRMTGILKMVGEELDTVLYWACDELCKTLHTTAIPNLKIRSAILNAGFQVSSSHAHKNAIKTNAPNTVIWDIMRAWVKLNPVASRRMEQPCPARSILETEPTVNVSFELHDAANPASREQGLLRYQTNPEKDWGPKSKAKDPEARARKRKKLNKSKPCNSIMEGKQCEKEDCEYSHDPELAKNYVPNSKRFPCKLFLQSKCKFEEDKCRYHHKGNMVLKKKTATNADANEAAGAAEAPSNGTETEAQPTVENTAVAVEVKT